MILSSMIINRIVKEFMQEQAMEKILGIALIICRNPVNRKFLAVHEKNSTWWVAGGRVDAPEKFTTGAIRQCKEEAGIDIQLKGILRIQQCPGYEFSRLKIVFYGEPRDHKQAPKNFADKQSLGAAYLSLEQILALKKQWRGPQLYGWAKYLEDGGTIYPLDLLQETDVAK